MIKPKLSTQYGQAMTEFVISAAFVLLPLFVLVPIVGKYVDMKHAAVQAARYEAWEYTAHYVSLSEESSGFTKISNSDKPVKSLNTVQNESRRRFFSNTAIPINTTIDRAGFDANAINPLWRYYDGSDMYDPTTLDNTSRMRGSDLTPDPTNVLSGVLAVADAVFSFLSSVMGAINAGAGFDAINADGYFRSTVSIPVVNAPDYTPMNVNNTAPLFMQDRNLLMISQAGILTDGWSAGGVDHALYQARGLVPTQMLNVILQQNVPVFNIPVQDLVATVLLSPELSSDSLKFGQMDIDAVHPSKLDSGGDHACAGGYCEY